MTLYKENKRGHKLISINRGKQRVGESDVRQGKQEEHAITVELFHDSNDLQSQLVPMN